MGGCVCSSNIKSYFKGYSDCVLKSDNNKIVPEQNIKIIPKEDIDNIDKMENNENNKQNERNEKNNDKITKNNNSNTHDENQILIDNNSNNNLYLQNIKHKEIENNKDSKNNSFSINNKINNNKNDNNNVNNNNLNNNNNISMDKLLQGKSSVKKAETNYNYNLGDHNVIFINISRDSSILKNGSEKDKIESSTPKMAGEKKNNNELGESKRIFSHFCKNKINEKSPKNQTTTNNQLIKHKHTFSDYMNHYSDEMLNALNSIRKDPESFITFIDDLKKNSKKTSEGVYIFSQNVEDKYMLTEEYFLIFEQIKASLRDIIKSNLPSIMEDFKYNDELEIMLDETKDYTMNQSHIEKSSSLSNQNDKCNNGNNNNIIKRTKKIHKILDLSDDKIANLILQKRKEIKNKYPDNIFKMNIIKDIKINILMQISMEEYYNHYDEKKMLKDIIFNPQYKNFAVSWANELNRKFISISCFA